MNKDIVRRLELLKLKKEEPVKIWDLYRMPDGSEVRKRWKGDTPSEQLAQMHKWEAETGATLIDIIIEVKEGDNN